MSTSAPLRIFPANSGHDGFLSTDLEYVDCPNCGASRHETVIVGEDGLTHLGGTFRIVRCCDCQLAFTNPRPTEASLEQFYPADYSPHLEKEPAERAQSRWRRRLELALLRQYYGYPPQPTDARTMLTSAAARIVIRRARARERWIPFRVRGGCSILAAGRAILSGTCEVMAGMPQDSIFRPEWSRCFGKRASSARIWEPCRIPTSLPVHSTPSPCGTRSSTSLFRGGF